MKTNYPNKRLLPDRGDYGFLQRHRRKTFLEHKEDLSREYHRRHTQIFKLAHKVKQMDVFANKYKEFETEENLFEWLQDVLKQRETGFEIEDDDTRELRTEMADYKAKKLFFESNQFLS